MSRSPSSNKTADLINRLIILEKFLELKSNECAYYRTKVHLMQMNSKSPKQSSSENSSTTSQSQPNRFRRKIKSKNLPFSSSIQHHRKIISKKTYAQNQNYYEENLLPSRTNEKNLIEQTIVSYINKHYKQSHTLDKNIQCNDNDFHQLSHTILILRLPQRLIKSLIKQHKKSIKPKLKVHISSELLKKLIQSSKQNQFTIKSQFGTISACVKHEDLTSKQQSQGIHVKGEVKTHHENRLPTIRHIARHKSSSSLTNVTQTIETSSSSADQIKRNKRRF